MFNTDLALQKTVSDIAKHRDQAIYQISQIAAHIDIFKSECKQIHQYCGNSRFLTHFSESALKKDVDRSAWRSAFSMTGIDAYMDKKARDEFEKSLEVDPPEFTADNIRSILIDARNKAEAMFNRGTVELFRGLCNKYKCNDTFKVGKKIITSHWFHYCRHFGNLSVNYSFESDINDFERIISVIKHGAFKKPSMVFDLRQCINEGETTYQNEYVKINIFKKGTAHIYILDEQLIDSINCIIAAYYGDGKVGKR